MLQELSIRNFAIIDTLHIDFEHGLNVMTGETGAGKSIIVGALGLLIGGRASSEHIRSSADEAVVEAVFDIETSDDISSILQEAGIDVGGNQLVVRRILSRSGKNRIYIANRPANMQLLSQIGGRLIDISGQYSQQLLLQADNHIDIVDRFGGLIDLRESYTKAFERYQEQMAELGMLVEKNNHAQQRLELISFQHDEIEKAHLAPDEEEDLLQERTVLANAGRLYEKAYGSYAGLYEDEQSCQAMLSRICRDVADAADIDPTLTDTRSRLDSLAASLEDIAFALRSYTEKIPMDQERLEAVEMRLDTLSRLKKKYGRTIEEIIAYKNQIEQELSSIEGYEERIRRLQGDIEHDAQQLWDAACEITRARQAAGDRLKKLIEQELVDIGMKKAVFTVSVASVEHDGEKKFVDACKQLNTLGRDTVEFHISTNIGEDPKPLSKIASGGEISRIVLAIKKILARNYRVPVMLFDEVDAGIGGAVAEAVGRKLLEIADSHQVLCITHLPQIASFGHRQYSVAKKTKNRRTVTVVEKLDFDGRLDEIARMLGGRTISEKTREHAREMLHSCMQKA